MASNHCPKCSSENTYSDGTLWICPECSHEWNPDAVVAGAEAAAEPSDDGKIRDAHGTELSDGDSVTILKELKIKGASSALKVGTKIRNIRLLRDAEDGHNIACKVDGIGALNIKSEFVRKVT